MNGGGIVEEVDNVLLNPPRKVSFFNPRFLTVEMRHRGQEEPCQNYQTLLHGFLP
jgi:hypothetical protein